MFRTYKQFGLVGSFPAQWRSVGCAEGAAGCGAWLGESHGLGKGLCSQPGAREGGQGRSLLLYGVVMRMNSLERREPPQLAGTKSRVAHEGCSASDAAVLAGLGSGHAALMWSRDWEVQGGQQAWGWGRSYSTLKGMHVLGHFVEIYLV